jgi:hypothetical protein
MSLIKVKAAWRDLAGVDAWLPELKTLLEEARDAATEEEAKPRLEVAAYLAGFIQESFPQTAEMDKLDDMARLMAIDIMKQTVDDRLANIAERTAEYVKLEKDLTFAAEQAEAAAEETRLKGITRLIDTSTEAISAAKELAKSLSDSAAGDKKIATLIEETIAAVEELRTAAAKLI